MKTFVRTSFSGLMAHLLPICQRMGNGYVYGNGHGDVDGGYWRIWGWKLFQWNACEKFSRAKFRMKFVASREPEGKKGEEPEELGTIKLEVWVSLKLFSFLYLFSLSFGLPSFYRWKGMCLMQAKLIGLTLRPEHTHAASVAKFDLWSKWFNCQTWPKKWRRRWRCKGNFCIFVVWLLEFLVMEVQSRIRKLQREMWRQMDLGLWKTLSRTRKLISSEN